MKALIASHTHNIYLKPGEIYVARNPVLISTVLGSCVAITLFSMSSNFAAICHAMLPENTGREHDLRYVDTALHYMYSKIVHDHISSDLTVKLFGGAQVLDVRKGASSRQTIGDQNVNKAEEMLAALGLTISARDTGGMQGRKLYFCTRSGDVYMRRMRMREHVLDEDTTI